MYFFKVRKARKDLKQVLHYARHVRNMHEDIAEPEQLARIRELEQTARIARRDGDIDAMKAAGEALLDACETIAPPRRHPKVRENVEVLFVAIAAAMAIRAYVFQPFKIPTGSMQPTLYGITVRPQQPGELDSFPERAFAFLVKGEMRLQDIGPVSRFLKAVFIGPGHSVVARTDGTIRTHETAKGIALDYRDNFDGGTITIFIGDTPHSIPKKLVAYCRFGEPIRAGESIIKGIVKAGDYILVNRVKYNFVRPERGDIVVFDAQDVARDAYYIKRLVGLPGDSISLDPPYLLVNGQTPDDPRFHKLFNNERYSGYVFGDRRSDNVPLLEKPADSIALNNHEYLFFGDNSPNSLDGRYFGGVRRERLLGTAFLVGLPFDRAGFPEIWH